MNLKWKVCGMREPGNIARALELEPDYMGFIFYPNSPRYVGQRWTGPGANFPSSTQKIGVFVNEDLARVKLLADRYGLDYVQLHGNESPGYCRDLFQSKYRIIKAINPNFMVDDQGLNEYKPWVEFFLFDTPSKQFGGTGKRFKWTLLEQYDNEIPVFLSGGISLNNMDSIVDLKMLNLTAVDINSCFEVHPGLKDINKLQEFKIKLQQL